MGIWRFVLIGLVFMTIGYMHVQATEIKAGSYVKPLTTFLELLEEEGLALSEWHIRLRDERTVRAWSEEDFLNEVNLLTEKLTGWENDMSSSEWNVRFTYNNPIRKMTESVQLFAVPSPHQGVYTYVITYSVIGENEKINDDVIAASIDKLQLKDAQSQVQIKADQMTNEQTSKIDLAEKWLNILGAKVVESLNEDTFVSVSAYNPTWSEHLLTDHKKMNVQVALRDKRLGTGTTVTIGTPIITIEY